MDIGPYDEIDFGNDDADLCLKLKASLEAAYRGPTFLEDVEYYQWAQSFLSLTEENLVDHPLSKDFLYYIAVRTLSSQAAHGAGRPLAHRALLDPEAFYMSLVSSMEMFGFC